MSIRRRPGETLDVYLLRLRLAVALMLGGGDVAALKRALIEVMDRR